VITTALVAKSKGILRHSEWDAVLVALSLAHAVALLSMPSTLVVAIGVWWTSNTVAHNFIHTPFFRSRGLNRLYSVYLSALLGIPQTLWRDRHLQHHRGQQHAVRWTAALVLETSVVLILWLILAAAAPMFFFLVYAPGYLAGLGLCFLQGHFEHARGTTSHYGRLYNLLFFNDGYHVEHHLRPGEHWTRLPQHPQPGAIRSRWPPVLRWIDSVGLESLERIVLRSSMLQRVVVAAHERAFRVMLPKISPVRQVTIVGGGLFPRTALILQKLLPSADLTIVDASAENLERARGFLGQHIECRHGLFDPAIADAPDLLVIPLAFIGDRERVYRQPAGRAVLVHDWLWRTRGDGVPISWWLLKRLNLVTRVDTAARAEAARDVEPRVSTAPRC
jgi:Fatty acid desaturase